MSIFNQFIPKIKQAFDQHPLEILLISAFAFPSLFIEPQTILDHYLGYWLWLPLYFVLTYISRSKKYCYFASLLVPIIGSIIIWKTTAIPEFFLLNSKYWAMLLLTLIVLCSFPFTKDNTRFTSRFLACFFEVMFAYIIAWITIGIICGILSSVKILFKLELSYKVFLHIIIFGQLWFSPILFLVFQQHKELHLNRSLEIVINFIFSPALIIYTFILYIYTSYIAYLGELPEGMVGNLVLPYLIAGLVIYCLQSICEKPQWKVFFRYYPYLATLPIVLLWFAILRRVEVYHLTEWRIYLIFSATILSLCYGILWIAKLRYYRNLVGLIMVGIFTIAFLINPKQIAFDSQTQRFKLLARELSLLDENEKIRENFEAVKLAYQVTLANFHHYRELVDVAEYLLYLKRSEYQIDLNDYDKAKELANEQLSQQLGNKFLVVSALYVYDWDKSISFKSNKIVSLEPKQYDHENTKKKLRYRFSFSRDNDYEINVQGYRRFIQWTDSQFDNNHIHRIVEGRKPTSASSANHDEVEQLTYKSSQYCYDFKEERLGCFNLDKAIKTIFENANVDITQRQTEETLEKLTENMTIIEVAEEGKLLVFERLDIYFEENVGYVFESASGLSMWIK